jgi:hypothetical protein
LTRPGRVTPSAPPTSGPPRFTAISALPTS